MGAAVATLAIALAGTPVVAVAAEATETIDLVSFNDFHGRIENETTVQFASTIERLRTENPNTLVISGGDNIGASPFVSAFDGDQPTIDLLNALELDASVVGNHEFDRGFPDLRDRVIGAENARNSLFPYLGANVRLRADGSPALEEYALVEKGGRTIGIIGAVTEATPNAIDPGGIADIFFENPVVAVNRVAAALSDGNASNGEADVLVAVYHEGATADGSQGDLDRILAQGGAPFRQIVQETAPAIDAIITGHSHRTYALQVPVTGQPGVTRPVIQAGNYMSGIGHIALEVTADNDVISSNVAVLPRGTENLSSSAPRVAAVERVVARALEAARAAGSTVVGSIAADITTAHGGGSFVDGVWTGGWRDARDRESSLGNLVAEAWRQVFLDPGRGGADIGVMNSGGLRSDLWFGANGTVTRDAATTLLPFSNSLVSAALTGAQVKEALEQQWGGATNYRGFLKLGLSENVRYTFDATRPRLDRITGIWIDDEPIDLERSYRVVGQSFIVNGGDGFAAFGAGVDRKTTGEVDVDVFTEYLGRAGTLQPPFDVRGVEAYGVPSGPQRAGSEATFGLNHLSLISRGSPQAQSVQVEWPGLPAQTNTFRDVGSNDSGWTPNFGLDIPAGAWQGTHLVRFSVPANDTIFEIPVAVEGFDATLRPQGADSREAWLERARSQAQTSALAPTIDVSNDSPARRSSITVELGSTRAHHWVSASMSGAASRIAATDWVQADASGAVTIDVAYDAPLGEQLLWLVDGYGNLAGAHTITVGAAEQAPDVEPAAPTVFDEASQDQIELSSDQVEPGASVTVTVRSRDMAEGWVAAWLTRSTATSTTRNLTDGWVRLDEEASTQIVIPHSTEADSYRISVTDEAGRMLGWAGLQVLEGDRPDGEQPGGGGEGGEQPNPEQPNPEQSDNDGDGTLPATGGAIASIVAATIAALIALTGALVLITRRRRAA